MTEREITDEILRICRSGKRKDGRAQDGVWCMRELIPHHAKASGGKYAIIDPTRSDPGAPNYSLLIVQGHTWAEVLEKMP